MQNWIFPLTFLLSVFKNCLIALLLETWEFQELASYSFSVIPLPLNLILLTVLYVKYLLDLFYFPLPNHDFFKLGFHHLFLGWLLTVHITVTYMVSYFSIFCCCCCLKYLLYSRQQNLKQKIWSYANLLNSHNAIHIRYKHLNTQNI